MKEFRNRTFSRLFDDGDRLRIEDMVFHRCVFENCTLSLTQDIFKMAEVRRVELLDCAVNGCDTGPMIVSEVTISRLRTSDLLIFWSPYLDRVVLSGEIGRMKINVEADPAAQSNTKQRRFDDCRASFYTRVEWALDISEARFKELISVVCQGA